MDFTLKEKSDVFKIFKVQKALVENKIGLRVKCFFLDDDGEYYNKKFDDYCSTHGIKKEKIV